MLRETNLGQFYTEDKISRLLISKILVKNPKSIVELGVGNGSLIRIAKEKWKRTKIIGGDIDPINVKKLSSEFPELNLYLINGLSSGLNHKLDIELGSIDIGICNPPYLPIKKDDSVKNILESSLLGKAIYYSVITSDLIFLAQNLRFIRTGGELGIILPDGLLTSHRFRYFREQLNLNYDIRGIIELPSKIFNKTEAKTHIVIIRKSKPKRKNTQIYLSDHNGNIIDSLKVERYKLGYRMDFNYNKWLIKYDGSTGIKLKDIKATIFRGKYSKKELDQSCKNFIHTTDLKNDINFMSYEDNLQKDKLNKTHAFKGDIVISRVGKRCLKRIMIIEHGSVLISDCLYVLRVESRFRNKLIATLNSNYGHEWIMAHSHGVCAKVISKSDLLNLRLIF